MEEPSPPPPPPVNWRELAASPLEPSRQLSIVPQHETDPMPRKMGFFERLGFGRRRA
jgi:hypothetical protein